jgi:2-methylisocitrate lyase-like PEP mutase family enzyme
MTDQTRKAEQFRALHVPGKPLVLFNIWDAGSAKAVATGGAKAIATGSWSVADANGFADGEQVPLTLAIYNLRRIVGATDLPVTVDLESGYGDAPEVVGESVALVINAGAVGCNLEDSFPANGKLRETVDQAARIRRARRMADAANIRFFINARTDIFFQRPPEQHNEAMVVAAVERAHAYAEAGADGLFTPRPGGYRSDRAPRSSVAAPAQHHGRRCHSGLVRISRAWCRKGEPWSTPLFHGDEGAGRRGAGGERLNANGPEHFHS